MPHSTGSAAIQYSRSAAELVANAASRRRSGSPPRHSAAETFGGTFTSRASFSTLTWPSPARISWPAIVQISPAPPRARKPRRSIGSNPIAAGLFLDDDGEFHFRRVDRADEV